MYSFHCSDALLWAMRVICKLREYAGFVIPRGCVSKPAQRFACREESGIVFIFLFRDICPHNGSFCLRAIQKNAFVLLWNEYEMKAILNRNPPTCESFEVTSLPFVTYVTADTALHASEESINFFYLTFPNGLCFVQVNFLIFVIRHRTASIIWQGPGLELLLIKSFSRPHIEAPHCERECRLLPLSGGSKIDSSIDFHHNVFIFGLFTTPSIIELRSKVSSFIVGRLSFLVYHNRYSSVPFDGGALWVPKECRWVRRHRRTLTRTHWR